ncbi:hypothetical protein FE576_19515 [Clostridioides difficile]|nr:hypothetical protein [Clostridioides difficile]
MKTYIKIISLFLVIVLIVGFFVPSFVLNDTVFAKEGPKSSTIGGIEIHDVKTADLEIVSEGIVKTIDYPLTNNFHFGTLPF